jgi:hypothetical protein
MPIGYTQEMPAQQIVQHSDFAPIWMQYATITLLEFDQDFLLFTEDSHYLIQWNEANDSLLFRGVNLNDNDELFLENARKGKWICTVAGAGKKSKCFKNGSF